MRTRHLAALLPFVAGMVGLAALPGCAARSVEGWPDRPGPRVVTSFVPLYCFALNVAGDDAAVRCVMTETGPHHFDPSPEHAVAIRGADLLLINGLDLDDSIARKMTAAARNKSIKIVSVGGAIPKAQLREGICTCGHDEDSEAKHDPDHIHYDPHVWLGIPQAIVMVEKIRDVLKEQDPAHAAGYEERSARYVARLNAVLQEGRRVLADKKDRRILTFHDSLGYFAAAFDLKIVDAIELAPGSEPDAKKLKELIATAKKENVRVITVEPQYDSNTSAKVIRNALRNEHIDAEFAVVDPLETARPDELNAEYYEKKMRENIRSLADRLK